MIQLTTYRLQASKAIKGPWSTTHSIHAGRKMSPRFIHSAHRLRLFSMLSAFTWLGDFQRCDSKEQGHNQRQAITHRILGWKRKKFFLTSKRSHHHTGS
jgi:hypothetical protein